MSVKEKQTDYPEAIDRLVEQLSQIPEVDSVILFGSRARGDNAARADVDLAVSCPEANTYVWDRIYEMVANARTLLPIDLVRMERVPEDLKTNIQRDGMLLFSRK